MEDRTTIYENHWGGGSTTRFIQGKYLVSLLFSTGSSVSVESLDFPGRRADMSLLGQDPEHCINQLIWKLDHNL